MFLILYSIVSQLRSSLFDILPPDVRQHDCHIAWGVVTVIVEDYSVLPCIALFSALLHPPDKGSALFQH